MLARSAAVVVVNLMWSIMSLLGYTLQLVFTAMQQCYMPYGYMFSNDNPHLIESNKYYQRKTNSIFEMLDLKDGVEVAEYAALTAREDAED